MNKKLVIGVLLILVGVGAIGGGVFVYMEARRAAAELANNPEIQFRAMVSSKDRAQLHAAVQGADKLGTIALPVGLVVGGLSLAFGIVLVVRSKDFSGDQV